LEDLDWATDIARGALDAVLFADRRRRQAAALWRE
jgi:hypothetical protein